MTHEPGMLQDLQFKCIRREHTGGYEGVREGEAEPEASGVPEVK